MKPTGAWSGRSVEELKRLSPGGVSLGKGRGPGRRDWDQRDAAKPRSGGRRGQGRGEEGVGGVTRCRGGREGRGQEAGAGPSGSTLSRLRSSPRGARPLFPRRRPAGTEPEVMLEHPVFLAPSCRGEWDEKGSSVGLRAAGQRRGGGAFARRPRALSCLDQALLLVYQRIPDSAALPFHHVGAGVLYMSLICFFLVKYALLCGVCDLIYMLCYKAHFT